MNRRQFLIHAVLVAGSAITARGAEMDWRKKLTTRPGPFPLPRPLTAEYDFGWSGFKAAEATAKFSRSKGVAKLDVTARTIGIPRTMWRMDTVATSTVNGATLRPIRLVETDTYAKKTIKSEVDYLAKGPRRTRTVTPPDPKPAKPKSYKLPHAHDLHSALLFIRSQRLAPGAVIRLCVYPGSSPYHAEITPRAPETVKAAGKEYSAIPCEIKLQSIEKDNSLTPHTKFRKATAWLSNDDDRLLLRIEADVFIGSVWAEMRETKFEGAKEKK